RQGQRLVVVSEGLGIGRKAGQLVRYPRREQASGLVPCEQEIFHCVFLLLTLRVMVGQSAGLLVEPKRFHALRDPSMEGLASWAQQALIHDALDEGMLEAIFDTRQQTYLVDQFRTLQNL